MQLAITGANGFLGRRTIAAALARRHEVVAVVRRPEAAEAVASLGARAVVVPSLEASALGRVFNRCQAVIHLAGIARATGESFEQVNIRGTEELLAAAKSAGLARVVTISGLGAICVDRAWAQNAYFRSKLEAERRVQSSDLPWVICRPSYILGPHDELVPALVSGVLHGAVQVVADGRVPMQPAWVGDATDGFVAAAEGLCPPGTVLDVVGPETVTLRDLISLVAGALVRRGREIGPVEIKAIADDQAPSLLGISEEEVQVMKCDALGDPGPLERLIGRALRTPKQAVFAAVDAELSV
jgi:NADH dehydrogenase